MYSIGEDQNELDWYINQKYSFDIIMYSLQVRHVKMRELVTRHMVPLVLSLKF